MKTRIMNFSGLFLIILLGGAAGVFAQDEEVATREITSLDFQKQRPKAETGEKRVKVTTQISQKQRKNLALIASKQRKYRLVKRLPSKTTVARIEKKMPGKTTVKTEQIGVTFWRLRPIFDDDGDVPVFPVRFGERFENWTAERVNSTTRFEEGDRVRFTIESSRTGYLYIINREFYTDGTTGAASVIFPTLRTRNGENRVVAGSLIDIPASGDSVPYFTIKLKNKGSKVYAGEELVVLITPEKLPLEIGSKPVSLVASQLEKWSAEWGTTVDIYDAEDGEGVAMTKVELTAAQTQSRALEQEEPLPQTIYKVRISSEMPLLVPFRMSAIAQ